LQTRDPEPAVAPDSPVRRMNAGLKRPIFCLVTDRSRLPSGDDAGLVRFAGAAAAAGVNLIQIRERDLGGRRLLALTRAVLAGAAGIAAIGLFTDLRRGVTDDALATSLRALVADLRAGFLRGAAPR